MLFPFISEYDATQIVASLFCPSGHRLTVDPADGRSCPAAARPCPVRAGLTPANPGLPAYPTKGAFFVTNEPITKFPRSMLVLDGGFQSRAS